MPDPSEPQPPSAHRGCFGLRARLKECYAPRLLSLLRLVAGALFLEHGSAKLLGAPHLAMFDHLSPLLITAGWLELVGGTLLVLGLFTRPVALLLSGEMAVAYFLVHAPRGPLPILNHGELAVLYCFVFLYLAAAGPGPWSLDALFCRHCCRGKHREEMSPPAP